MALGAWWWSVARSRRRGRNKYEKAAEVREKETCCRRRMEVAGQRRGEGAAFGERRQLKEGIFPPLSLDGRIGLKELVYGMTCDNCGD